MYSLTSISPTLINGNGSSWASVMFGDSATAKIYFGVYGFSANNGTSVEYIKYSDRECDQSIISNTGLFCDACASVADRAVTLLGVLLFLSIIIYLLTLFRMRNSTFFVKFSIMFTCIVTIAVSIIEWT